MERRRACYIGGVAFDEAALADHLARQSHTVLIVTGSGRGAESWVRREAPKLGLEVYVPPLFSVRRQVIDIYVQSLFGGLLVLVGDGFRVREAKKMLARSNGWPAEVVQL